MHILLEEYLSEVTKHLGPMPVKQRMEELREMRAHLENALIVSRELGQSEKEAAQSVMAQFGTPQNLGENTVWAWRRGMTQTRRSLLGASLTTTSSLCLLSFVMNQRASTLFLDSLLGGAFGRYLGRHPGYAMDFTQAMLMTTFGLAGLAAGLLFPKRALWGVCLGLALFWAGFAMVGGVRQLQALVSVDGLTHQGRGGWTLAAILGAWGGSRWRRIWGRQGRLARG